jgi:uncharacterized LabA/DUF88 family protein
MQKKDKSTFIPPRNRSDMTHSLARLIDKKKVGIYIDAANLYHGSHIAKINIDYNQLISWFKAHCKVKNANFYSAYDVDDQKQIDFLNDLEKNGYNVVKKPLKVFEHSKKGNMDIEIAVDCLLNQNMYDVLVLMSGDGDFGYLVHALDVLGKETIIIGIGGFTSFDLHTEADNYFFLNRIREVWGAQKKPKADSSPTVTQSKNPLRPVTNKIVLPQKLEKSNPEATPIPQKDHIVKKPENSRNNNHKPNQKPQQKTQKPANNAGEGMIFLN